MGWDEGALMVAAGVKELLVLEHGWAVVQGSQVLGAHFPLCLFVGAIDESLHSFEAVVVTFHGWSLIAHL